MSQYTSQEKIELYLQRQLNDYEAQIVEDVIENISSIIDSYTGRAWIGLDADAPVSSERVYDANGGREFYIDDFTTLEKVELLDSDGSPYITLEDADEFIKYPLNKTYFSSIYLRNYSLPRGSGRIRVTGVFSSGAVPKDVVMVATKLSASMINNSVSSVSNYKKESIEGYSYERMSTDELEAQDAKILKSLEKWRKILL